MKKRVHDDYFLVLLLSFCSSLFPSFSLSFLLSLSLSFFLSPSLSLSLSFSLSLFLPPIYPDIFPSFSLSVRLLYYILFLSFNFVLKYHNRIGLCESSACECSTDISRLSRCLYQTRESHGRRENEGSGFFIRGKYVGG